MVERITVLSLESKQVFGNRVKIKVSHEGCPVEFADLSKLLEGVVHVFGDF